jgi:hypothetical protein
MTRTLIGLIIDRLKQEKPPENRFSDGEVSTPADILSNCKKIL